MNTDGLQSRYQLSPVRVVNDDYEGAMSELLAMLRGDRGFLDDVGRDGLLALFDLLGAEHPLVARHRARMLEADED